MLKPASQIPAATVTTEPADGLTADIKAFALRLMQPDDMVLMFDVRLVTANGDTPIRVLGANTLPGMAVESRMPILSKTLEEHLKSMILNPMTQRAQELMQHHLMAVEMTLNEAAPALPNMGEDQGSVEMLDNAVSDDTQRPS